MTIDDFDVVLDQLRREFVDMWRKKMKEEPDDYPESLPAPDWFEQFDIFLQSSAAP